MVLLADTAALHLYFFAVTLFDYDHIARESAVGNLLARIQDEYQRQTEHRRQQLETTGQQRTSIYKFTSLKELHLDFNSDLNIPKIDTFLVLNNSLTRFILTFRPMTSAGYVPCNLSNILLSCPVLKSFEARGLFVLELQWTPPVVGQQQPFPLRSLFLDCAELKPESLENLSALTPRLKVLKLVAAESTTGRES
ncbi:hypothetical protein BGW39_006254 [Mortierella sp. 14UC]|nr:hypothetical protein BGW39_006254 [Mortierella sp. 14UC]